jgi:hypothetical protein
METFRPQNDEHSAQHARLLELAAKLAGHPVRAVQLDFQTLRLLRPHLSPPEHLGIDTAWPHCVLSVGPRGLSSRYGIVRHQLEIEDRPVMLAHFMVPASDIAPWELFDFWTLPAADFRRFYKFVRRCERQASQTQHPIMHDADARALWSNTIGFLRHARDALRKFNVPQKRGVFLTGAPGNGKTLASRWLLAQCRQHGLCWNCVTPEELREARCERRARELFELSGPGIVLFDDLDQALLDREELDRNSDLALFLTELDGVFPREGVVYLFTSNLEPENLDPAIRRPGRVDFVLRFDPPDEHLRRQLISERWHAEIVAALDLEEVVAQTEGLSFAQIEELKKLLVLGWLETRTFDWGGAWRKFRAGSHLEAAAGRIGFAAPLEFALRLGSVGRR